MEEKSKGAQNSADFRKRVYSRGYGSLQIYVPITIRKELRAMVREVVGKWLKKQNANREQPSEDLSPQP